MCEAPTTTGFVNHLVMSSEPIIEDNVWQSFAPGEVVGVDWRMHLERRQTGTTPADMGAAVTCS